MQGGTGVTSKLSREVLHQGHLVQVVRDLFPNEDIVTNVKKDPNVLNPNTGQYFEIDLWLPNKSLCFEFQDEYHFNTTWYANVPLEYVKEKDDLKKGSIGKKGSSLVNVPYWWDGTRERLQATLQFERPDFQFDCGVDPIPLNPLPQYLLDRFIPGVGELMYASFPPSHFYFDDVSRDNPWWMGEKYDGVRVCWNYSKEAIYTRSGRVLPLGSAFYDSMPSIFLDCELWFGRSSWSESQRLILTDTANMENFRIMAFDNPDPLYHNVSFEFRYAALVSEVEKDNPVIMLAPRVRCTTKRHLITSVDLIIKDGGEGVIVRKPKSLYEHGRSTFLWKIKATREDAEALILNVERDKSLLAQLYDGTTIVIPPQEIMPAKGDIVTITYESYGRNALPANPVIERIRKDVIWRDVVRDAMQQKKFMQVQNGKVDMVGNKQKAAQTRARKFFEDFAKRKRKDPLQPATWYSLASELDTKQVTTAHKRGGIIRALIRAFPEIGLKASKFTSLPQKYWNDVGRRKAFFTSLAKQHGFDALVASSWYSAKVVNTFLENKRARSILAYYTGNFARALIHLFPDIGLDKNKLTVVPGANSFSTHTQRELLVKFAKENRFDPLRASGWYAVTEEMMLESKELGPLLRKLYARNMPKMLASVFPEIRFKNYKFADYKRNSWVDIETRRELFVHFAREKNFDPLIAENWYLCTATEICDKEGFESMLRYYEGSFAKALIQLFPNVSFDPRKFAKIPSRFWEEESERKIFFDDIAKQLSFDPLVAENWYSVPDEVILNMKGATSVLAYYDMNYAKALLTLFPDIGLDESKFKNNKHMAPYFSYAKNRRLFLDNIAIRNGRDPLNADTWYDPEIIKVVQSTKGSVTALSYHHSNYARALLGLYPEIEWDLKKFRKKMPRKHV